jgi:hypothetical protein
VYGTIPRAATFQYYKLHNRQQSQLWKSLYSVLWGPGVREWKYILKRTIFWDFTTKSPVKSGALIRACFMISCLDYSWTLKMEAICSSELSVDFHRTTRRYIPATTLHIHRSENLQLHTWFPHILIGFSYNKRGLEEPSCSVGMRYGSATELLHLQSTHHWCSACSG